MYESFGQLLRWVRKQTPRQHRVHITNYRQFIWTDINLDQDPCPYCLSLSLWFCYFSSLGTNWQAEFGAEAYPFLRMIGYTTFWNPTPFIFLYKTSERLWRPPVSIWNTLYAHGLLGSFFDIFKGVCHWIREMQRYKRRLATEYGARYKIRSLAPYHSQPLCYQLFATKQGLRISYIPQQPFHWGEQETVLEGASEGCERYHGFLDLIVESAIKRFECVIAAHPLSLSQFRDLQQQFLRLLKDDQARHFGIDPLFFAAERAIDEWHQANFKRKYPAGGP